MIIDNIKLGFKDLLKNIKNFILFLLFIASITLIVVASTSSLIEIFKEKNKININYFAVPVSYDMYDFVNVRSRVEKILENGGYSQTQCEKINEEYGVSLFVLVGKFQKNSENRILFAVDKNNLDLLIQKEKNLKEISIDEIDNKKLKLVNIDVEFKDRELTFVSFDNKYSSLSNFKLTHNDVMNLIENVKFNNEDIKNGLDIEFEKAILNNDIVFKKHISYQNEEISFILKYVYFYTILLLVSFIISLGIFIKSLYKKLFREYRIHIICGATKKGIFIRNSVFVFTLIFMNFIFFNLLNRFMFNTVFSVNIFSNLIYLIILEFVILNMLTREALTATVMEGE